MLEYKAFQHDRFKINDSILYSYLFQNTAQEETVIRVQNINNTSNQSKLQIGIHACIGCKDVCDLCDRCYRWVDLPDVVVFENSNLPSNWGIGGAGNNYNPNLNGWFYSGGFVEIIPNELTLGNFIDDPNYFEEDNMQISFNYQLNTWPTISNVLSKSDFVEYDYRNCLVLVKDQITKANVRDIGYGSAFKVYDNNGGPYPNIAKDGVEYIISKLSIGKPIIVGVDNRPGTPSLTNADGKTDHFIVIVGSGNDVGGNFFTFFDNATNNIHKGTSNLNKLYYNDASGKSAAAPQVAPYYDYIVTQIRKNK